MDANFDVLVVAEPGRLPRPLGVVHEDVVDEQSPVGLVSVFVTVVTVGVVRGEEVVAVVFVVGAATLQVHVTLQIVCGLHISGQNQSLRGEGVVAVVILLVRVRPDEQHDRPWRFRVLGDGPQVADVQGLLG